MRCLQEQIVNIKLIGSETRLKRTYMPESKIKSEVISRIRVYHKVQVVSRDEFTIKSSVVSGERIKNLSELPSSQNKEENTNSYLIHSDHEIKNRSVAQLFRVLKPGITFSWQVFKAITVAIEI